MSYARFSETSDVYVYAHVGGFIECCGCLLSDVWEYHSREAIVAHMGEHVEAGHLVPEYLLVIDTYDEHDFTAMCQSFMCRKDEGHEGDHSPHAWRYPYPLTSPASNDYRCPCGEPKSHPVHANGSM
ncbi:MAG: hypothetical protein J0H96_05775 [Microbacterium ginsengisoli]|nr:hypothetical protein [Microbacterium ginsengisoli]